MVKVLSDAEEVVSVINSADEEGWAPIHSAASIGHSEIMDILLSRGEKFMFYAVFGSCKLFRSQGMLGIINADCFRQQYIFLDYLGISD